MRTTLKDIAQATGLSVTSISLVLNARPNRLSEESRRKVLKPQNSSTIPPLPILLHPLLNVIPSA